MENSDFVHREDKFELPLFNAPGVGCWNDKVSRLQPPLLSDQTAWTVFNQLFRLSKDNLSIALETRDKLIAERNELVARRDELIANGEQETPAFEKVNARLTAMEEEISDLAESIERQQDAFEKDAGGASQFPQVSCDDFSFPIYPISDAKGKIFRNIPIQPYPIKGSDEAFEPPWFPRCGDRKTGWMALEVPTPPEETLFRPSGPRTPDDEEEVVNSDGNIIFYDLDTKREYDFWQATTVIDIDKKSRGGGQSGNCILTTGGVTAFDAYGHGRRSPLTEPSGSCRASGLPYLGGLLLPEDFADFERTPINHAFAFTLPELRCFEIPLCDLPRNWVYPATTTEFDAPIADPYALAAGQRITLNDELYRRDGTTVETQKLIKNEDIPWVVRRFLEALFHYGAFLVDGGGGFGFVAEDIHTANPNLEPDRFLELIGPETA